MQGAQKCKALICNRLTSMDFGPCLFAIIDRTSSGDLHFPHALYTAGSGGLRNIYGIFTKFLRNFHITPPVLVIRHAGHCMWWARAATPYSECYSISRAVKALRTTGSGRARQPDDANGARPGRHARVCRRWPRPRSAHRRCRRSRHCPGRRRRRRCAGCTGIFVCCAGVSASRRAQRQRCCAR